MAYEPTVRLDYGTNGAFGPTREAVGYMEGIQSSHRDCTATREGLSEKFSGFEEVVSCAFLRVQLSVLRLALVGLLAFRLTF